MLLRIAFSALLISLASFSAPAALAQTMMPLSGFSYNPDEDVEITADSLSIDQDAQLASFKGNVRAVQGQMLIAANQIDALYADPDSSSENGIESLRARGKVRFETEAETITADTANYDIGKGVLIMRGNVTLRQAEISMTADQVNIDLEAGTGQFQGGVRTLFRPKEDSNDG